MACIALECLSAADGGGQWLAEKAWQKHFDILASSFFRHSSFGFRY